MIETMKFARYRKGGLESEDTLVEQSDIDLWEEWKTAVRKNPFSSRIDASINKLN